MKERLMNILFVLYHDFSTASAIHVHNFANSLVKFGCSVTVAVPFNKDSVERYFAHDFKYNCVDYADLINSRIDFEPEIVHAWTPRENIRIFCGTIKQRYPDSRLIVHLEDNEEIILEKFTRLSVSNLRRVNEKRLDYVLPLHVSHPTRYKEFLAVSDGVSVIIDELRDFAPPGKRIYKLWPIIDLDRFSPDVCGCSARNQYRILSHELVICYCGSVHEVNCEEVRSLYLAVALANREGIPVRLIRTGRDVFDFLGDLRTIVEPFVIELGHVSMEQIPVLMAAADILIQPGYPDSFNRYRLPSKIPEFLAMGKPVLLPRVNIGLLAEEKKIAYIQGAVDAVSILTVLKKLKDNRADTELIAKNARQFAVAHFEESVIIKGLLSFYNEILTMDC